MITPKFFDIESCAKFPSYTMKCGMYEITVWDDDTEIFFDLQEQAMAITLSDLEEIIRRSKIYLDRRYAFNHR